MAYDASRLTAWTQASLAFFYGLMFLGIAVAMALFWDHLSKVDVGFLTMIATGAMQQSKDAGNYFFMRHRPLSGDETSPNGPPPAGSPASK